MKAGARDRLSQLASAATACRGSEEFRAEILAWLSHNLAFDAALLVQLDGHAPTGRTAVGLDPAFVDRFVDGLTTSYRRDFQEIMTRFNEGFTTGPTTRLEHWAALPDRQGLEEDLMFPLGLRIGGGGPIMFRGAPNAILLLARSGRVREFTTEEGAFLANAAPIFALGLALQERTTVEPPSPAPAPRRAPRERLTARERSVIEYAVLGLSNREIGLALGTSGNTIRNQLASIFAKLSVGSRSEMVAVALTEGLVEPPQPKKT